MIVLQSDMNTVVLQLKDNMRVGFVNGWPVCITSNDINGPTFSVILSSYSSEEEEDEAAKIVNQMTDTDATTLRIKIDTGDVFLASRDDLITVLDNMQV